MKLRRLTCIAFALSLVLLLCLGGTGNALAFSDGAPEPGCADILVKFKASTDEGAIAGVHRRCGGTVMDIVPQIGLQVVEVPAGQLDRALAAYNSSPLVEYAEPDGWVQVQSIPNDPYYTSWPQWGLTKIHAPEAWDITRGSANIHIAILDSGIDQDHEDLAGKIVAGANFSGSPALDDVFNHGTHVAGIAAAITNNTIGVAGVGYSSSLMNVKVLNDYGGGNFSQIVQAIIWAADNGAEVINMSFNTSGWQSIYDAVDYAWQQGAVLVASAGNAGSSIPTSPASIANCIAVAATDWDDRLAGWSNYGDWVDVAAPGTGIVSTVPFGYNGNSGTSMAAPHVAGLAALLFTVVTDANGNGHLNDEVRYAIETTCDDIGVGGIGYGRINAYQAVTSSPPPEGPTAGFSAAPVGGDEPLTVDFTDTSISIDGIVSWLWDFGDGQGSTEQDPSHVYDQGGVYTVSLTIAEADGHTDTHIEDGYITVLDTGPTAGFSAALLGGDQPLGIGFTDLSTSYDGITSWLWDLGDGSTDTQQSPQHTYTEAGSYWVTLTVTESDGSSSSVTHAVDVTLPCISVAVTRAAVPLAGCRVYACTAGGDYAGYSQLTDTYGQTAFTLPEGSYRFRVYYDRAYWWSQVVTYPGSATIAIPGSTAVTVTAAGAPLEGSWVYACTPEGAYAGCKPTDVSGQVAFTLPEGSYRFRVYCDRAYWWSQVTASPGSTIIDIPAATVVTVTTAEGPLQGSWVYAYTAEGAYAGCSRLTDASGQASLTLPQGSYRFRAYYDGAYWWSPVTTSPGSTIIDIPAATVVTITTAEGPLGGCWVYGYTAEGAYAGCSRLTDASGQASFTLSEGSYKFRIYYDRGYWWSQVITSPGSAIIDIPAATLVTVTVAGAPLQGSWVYAYTADGAYAGCSRLTDASGRASFTLPDGSYKFRAYCDGAYWWSPAITCGGSTTIDIPSATVVAVTASGTPLQGSWVYAYTAEGRYAGYGATDASGQASFTLPAGSYRFRVYYDGAYRWSQVVASPGTATIEIP